MAGVEYHEYLSVADLESKKGAFSRRRALARLKVLKSLAYFRSRERICTTRDSLSDLLMSFEVSVFQTMFFVCVRKSA